VCNTCTSPLSTRPPSLVLPKLSRRYPAGGFSKNNTLLGAMGNTCEPLNAQYTLSGMGGAGAPAPAQGQNRYNFPSAGVRPPPD